MNGEYIKRTKNEELKAKIFKFSNGKYPKEMVRKVVPLIKETFKKENISIQIRSYFDSAYDGIYFLQKGYGAIYVFKKDKVVAKKILKDIFYKLSK